MGGYRGRGPGREDLLADIDWALLLACGRGRRVLEAKMARAISVIAVKETVVIIIDWIGKGSVFAVRLRLDSSHARAPVVIVTGLVGAVRVGAAFEAVAVAVNSTRSAISRGFGWRNLEAIADALPLCAAAERKRARFAQLV